MSRTRYALRARTSTLIRERRRERERAFGAATIEPELIMLRAMGSG